MQSRDEVLEQVRAALIELFEIEPDKVIPEARLNDDLEIDSIDAVDLAISLQEMTGKRVTPEAFKGVRTVGDVVEVVHQMLQA